MYLYTSPGIGRIEHLETLLGAPARRHRRWMQPKVSAVVGWGRKPTAQKAYELAAQHALPYHCLEDGFLRSVNPGNGESPLSIVVDDLGIYYDATSPSRLETLIAERLSVPQMARARCLCTAWKSGRVSKYNHRPDYAGELPEHYVLVVDQTLSDASISFGLAGEQHFQQMLTAALNENPDCIVLVKIHPDVFSGRKRGYFNVDALSKTDRVRVLVDDVHPVCLIEQAQAIYVVTSQMGFEGLLWGKRVRTFGMPFYAGWGLTDDELPAPPRRASATLEQLIHASLITYARYLDPETGHRCEPERLIEWMALQRRVRARYPRRIYAVNFLSWKHSFVELFFQAADIRFVDHLAQVPDGEIAVCWGAGKVLQIDLKQVTAGNAAGKQVETIHVEDGFLRSVGLGADVVQPVSWVMDRQGIYYDATRPSDLEQLLLTTTFDDELLTRAEALRVQIVAGGFTKYNVGSGHWVRPALNHLDNSSAQAGRFILVAGQVESDASIAFGTQEISKNIDLLQAVRQANPDAYIIYKPHPDVVAGLRRKGERETDVSRWCDEVVINIAVDQMLNEVDEVHVMTSLTGFEALLRDKKVVTYGQPFYAGWGLTEDHDPLSRRTRTLSLSELIAATLILYPTYISRVTGKYTTPERVLLELAMWKASKSNKVSLLTRLRRLVIQYIVKVN